MPSITDARILVVTTNAGVERDELIVPLTRLREAGATVTHAAQEAAPVRTLVMDDEPGPEVDPDTTIAEVSAGDFDLLVLPGGTINADTLRLDDDALDLVRDVSAAGNPVAAICHAPWTLVEANLVRGKSLTSFPSLRTDVTNAGGTWVDEEVVRDDSGKWTLITSRTPDDLDAFVTAIVSELGG
ncbi:DJ-1/PfpI/YhbO family deglycase/protease [Sanguibacter suaedae]|uniref:DJ-1/PfpI/YhbO family deglycase/protease n=1 Tax=Sanguibacter suaedae TaxID=2795737 RepID=A0A934IAF7_9MICO|nr:DJ-1/PfpI/YhbO family deglycase/protease [Sanguibacter suaedae]MBI9114862.1 DJ-1/PfpI/YhbO family deglycase/protease [Sanguibacter suaedae]